MRTQPSRTEELLRLTLSTRRVRHVACPVQVAPDVGADVGTRRLPRQGRTRESGQVQERSLEAAAGVEPAIKVLQL